MPLQAGAKTLDAPAVEITYGMERILMALQGATNFKDIRLVGWLVGWFRLWRLGTLVRVRGC